MLTDAKKIGLRLKKCAARMGIYNNKDEGAIPFGIDQGTFSKWTNGKELPGGTRQKFTALCCYVGMSFEDVERGTIESFVPENVTPKDAKILEGIIEDLVTLEKRGYDMQITATHLKAVLMAAAPAPSPAPIPAEERSMLEGLDKLALAQIQKGLSLVLGNVSSDSPEYDACMHALQSVKRSGATLAPKHLPQESGANQSQPQADAK